MRDTRELRLKAIEIYDQLCAEDYTYKEYTYITNLLYNAGRSMDYHEYDLRNEYEAKRAKEYINYRDNFLIKDYNTTYYIEESGSAPVEDRGRLVSFNPIL